MSNLITYLEIKESQGKYVSERIQLGSSLAVLRLASSQPANIIIERSVIGVSFVPVPDFELAIQPDTPVEIGISDAKSGQYIRVVSTAPLIELTALV